MGIILTIFGTGELITAWRVQRDTQANRGIVGANKWT